MNTSHIKNIPANKPESWLTVLCEAVGCINEAKRHLRDSEVYVGDDQLNDACTLIEWAMRKIDETMTPDGPENIEDRCSEL
jgi:hypothetical protein